MPNPSQWSRSRPAGLLRAALLLLLSWGLAPSVRAQEAQAGGERPFMEGEVLAYQVSLGKHGRSGTGWLRVQSAPPLREEPVVLLRFDFETSVGPFRIQHHSRSWLSSRRMAALRYEVDERIPLKSVRERVEIFPDEGRWVRPTTQGRSSSPEPLDELSFLYALRTMELTPGRVHRMDRHFDARRNPVVVRVLRREPLRVPAGEFSTVVVEMEVRDPERFGGRGLLRLYLTDDERRLPVRIESQVPVAGQLVLELEPRPPDNERRAEP
ncbi:MAG TPA: DUF3108 domain-containing protein [Archangium sp.]|uniref:DUF3108 domain-containing protein n=1 Tax=Archangium sp. TaxID=1872627 RepID=UPI002E37A16E|nr:DUF3108 domain-containing protein [Archangium sp.]HEX5750568.1 DUF3108 domain-containing protein [Archangium sp.]